MYKNLDFDIVMQRTETFCEIARRLDALIKRIDLPQPVNDELVDLIIQQVQAGESGAFCQALVMAGAVGVE